jgi:hypothetical protein
MPKGHHYGRTQTRAYTSEYHRIHANVFKPLLTRGLGCYSFDSEFFGEQHSKMKLTETKSGIRIVTFLINDRAHKMALMLDHRSASAKLYITCPYCQRQRQHLYALKYAYSCRQCIGLHYASQSERPQERLMRRIRKLRKGLWGADWPDVNNMFEEVAHWPKPKWMRWQLFEKKRNEITKLEHKYWPMFVTQMKTTFDSHFIEDSKKMSLNTHDM